MDQPHWRSGLLLAVIFWAASAGPAISQSSWQPGHAGIGFGQPQTKQWVQLVSSPAVSLKSGRGEIALRFQIQNGLHINSHAPHSSFLIPTALTLDAPAGVQISKIEYPQGNDYALRFAPKDPLSVYTGEFGLLIRVHARPGQYQLHGSLRYQACDERACNPPKTLPLTLNLIAR